MRDIGIGARVEEIREIIMEKKRRLRGRKERIVEDLTWKERKMRWKLKRYGWDTEKLELTRNGGGGMRTRRY